MSNYVIFSIGNAALQQERCRQTSTQISLNNGRKSWFQINSKETVNGSLNLNGVPTHASSYSQLKNMFSDRKNNFVPLGKNSQSHVKNEGKGGENNLHNPNKFSVLSDGIISCQQSTLLSLNEKRNKLLKLLEKDSEEVEVLKTEEINENLSDDEDKKLNFEETNESIEVSLPLQILNSDSEEEKVSDNEEDWKEMNENTCNLESICGLGEVKESLFNILIYPSLYPQFFPRKIRWNQILLYGPPGTGKTMLAKALAFEINATMHKITSADLLSHWQGQTEKLIKNLFEEIRTNSEPKILFFDEIDGLFRTRTNDESDSIRRIKTELLVRLDEFTAEFGNHQTFLIGATNCPWEIDSSFMRRFHKKIFVPLPDKKARMAIIKKSFENIEMDLTDLEWNKIGDRTEGYSGSDLVNVVMTACCERFMELKHCKFWKAKDDLWIPVGSCSLFSTQMNFEDIHPEKLGIRNIIFSDLVGAIGKTPKTVEPEILLKYLEFSEKNKVEK